MKTKECPGCAMDVDADADECPICSYDFPRQSPATKGIALLLVVLLIVWLLW
ncbi:MAG: hypothetical protein ACNA78_06470 [Balneolaceae bacterium]